MSVFQIVHLLYEALLHLPVCVQSLWYPYEMYVRELYRSVQRVYENPVRVRVMFFQWCTTMRVFGIVHSLYKVPRDLPICVQSLCGHPYGNVSQEAVQLHTAGVPKCCLRQSAPLRVVYCYARFRNHTPALRGATGPSILCTKPVRHPYGDVGDETVQIGTIGVPKCYLRQSAPLGLVYCYAHFQNGTPTVRGATTPPSLCTKPVAPVRDVRQGAV